MENSIPAQIPFPQPLAEPSDNSASHSSGNGYKATPDIQIGIDPCMETQTIDGGHEDASINSIFLGCRLAG